MTKNEKQVVAARIEALLAQEATATARMNKATEAALAEQRVWTPEEENEWKEAGRESDKAMFQRWAIEDLLTEMGYTLVWCGNTVKVVSR